MASVRKNQARLSRKQWQAFVDAIDAIRRKGAAKPTYDDFVDVHAKAMSDRFMGRWQVHTMTMPGGMLMRGRNFLAWHRWFLLEFEERLKQHDPTVTVPYWDWGSDPKIPPRINRPELLKRWRVRRDWTPSEMPDRAEARAVMRKDTFEVFQRRLETIHGFVHIAVGGTKGQMSGARSPADPIFWLHHANIDRLWDRWEHKHPGKRPKNSNEKLKPASMRGIEFGIKVSEILKASNLGYRYR